MAVARFILSKSDTIDLQSRALAAGLPRAAKELGRAVDRTPCRAELTATELKTILEGAILMSQHDALWAAHEQVQIAEAFETDRMNRVQRKIREKHELLGAR